MKATAYCSIDKYIETKYPDLHALMSDTCVRPPMPNLRFGKGATMIIPDDVKIIQGLVDKGTRENLEEAIKKLRACMLSDCYMPDRVSNLGSHKLINSLGQILSIKEVKGNTIVLDNKTVLTFEPVEFIRFSVNKDGVRSEREMLAIWKAKGPIPIDGKQFGDMMEAAGSNDNKEGGALYSRVTIEDMLRQIYRMSIEERVHETMKNRYPMFNNIRKFHNPYLGAMNCLFTILKERHSSLFDQLIELKDTCPEVAFYSLVQPFNIKGTQLISDDIIAEWGGALCENYSVTYNNYFESFGSEPTDHTQIREQVLNASMDAARITVDHYKRTCTSYKIKTLVPDCCSLLLWLDEFRLIFGAKFANVIAQPDPTKLIASVVSEIRKKYPGNNYADECSIYSRSNNKLAQTLAITDFFAYKLSKPSNVEEDISALLAYKQAVNPMTSQFISLVAANRKIVKDVYLDVEFCPLLASAYAMSTKLKVGGMTEPQPVTSPTPISTPQVEQPAVKLDNSVL